MDSLQMRDNRLEQALGNNPSIEETTLEIRIRKTREALKQNPIMIDDGFVNDVIALSTEFYARFPGAKIEGYIERLKTLKLEYFGKFAYQKYAVKYLPSINVIAVNKDKIMKEDIDCKHALMKAIIAMVTTKDNDYGFGSLGYLEALNEGFIDMTARTLVGGDENGGFNQEREIVNLIGRRIGVNPFINAFFTNNPELLMDAMLDKYQNLEQIEAVLDQINHNMYTKKEDSYLIPVDIETELIKMFGKADLELMKQPLTYSEQGNTKTR